mgnify:CR=1 FL=1
MMSKLFSAAVLLVATALLTISPSIPVKAANAIIPEATKERPARAGGWGVALGNRPVTLVRNAGQAKHYRICIDRTDGNDDSPNLKVTYYLGGGPSAAKSLEIGFGLCADVFARNISIEIVSRVKGARSYGWFDRLPN